MCAALRSLRGVLERQMLGFVSNMIGPRANPIGIDFGTDTLRVAQVALANGEMKVIAAATADIPGHVRNDAPARLAFLTSTLREILVGNGFRGRQVVVGLPASALSMVHVRVPMLEGDALAKAVPLEARGKLPYDPSHAVVRHLVAGEIYHGQERKLEAIVLASPRAIVEHLLAAVARAKLDVVGMNVEPLALMDCFAGHARRREDKDATLMYVDIGASGSRAVISREGHIMFARGIAIGGDHFTRAVSQMLKVGFDDARLVRLKVTQAAMAGGAALAEAGPQIGRLECEPDENQDQAPVAPEETESEENSFALLGAGMAQRGAAGGTTGGGTAVAPAPVQTLREAEEAPAEVAPATGQDALESRRVETAVREPLGRLVEELKMCRRYHDATFQNAPVSRLVFVGGEARHRELCAYIAREMGLAACVGDPMARMGRVSDTLPADCGLDRRGAQPAWAVALGLSLGSRKVAPHGKGT